MRLDKSLYLTIWDVGEMVVLDDVDPTIKKLETDPKGRESKIGRLDEYDDTSSREARKGVFDRLDLSVIFCFLELSFECR